MKKNNIWLTASILLLVIGIGATSFMVFTQTFISEKIVRTQTLTNCNAYTSNLEDDDWDCGKCELQCPREWKSIFLPFVPPKSQYDYLGCKGTSNIGGQDMVTGKSLLDNQVSFKSICVLSEEQIEPKAKTVCGTLQGSKFSYSGKLGEHGGYDVYWLDERDENPQIKDDCTSSEVCLLSKDGINSEAKCVDKESEPCKEITRCDQPKTSIQTVKVCGSQEDIIDAKSCTLGEVCENAKCIETKQTIEVIDDKDGIAEAGESCTSDFISTCQDGTPITTLECINGHYTEIDAECPSTTPPVTPPKEGNDFDPLTIIPIALIILGMIGMILYYGKSVYSTGRKKR